MMLAGPRWWTFDCCRSTKVVQNVFCRYAFSRRETSFELHFFKCKKGFVPCIVVEHLAESLTVSFLCGLFFDADFFLSFFGGFVVNTIWNMLNAMHYYTLNRMIGRLAFSIDFVRWPVFPRRIVQPPRAPSGFSPRQLRLTFSIAFVLIGVSSKHACLLHTRK